MEIDMQVFPIQFLYSPQSHPGQELLSEVPKAQLTVPDRYPAHWTLDKGNYCECNSYMNSRRCQACISEDWDPVAAVIFPDT